MAIPGSSWGSGVLASPSVAMVLLSTPCSVQPPLALKGPTPVPSLTGGFSGILLDGWVGWTDLARAHEVAANT